MAGGRVTPFAATLRLSRLACLLAALWLLLLLAALSCLDLLPALLLLATALFLLWRVLRQSGMLRAPLAAFRVDARGALWLRDARGEWRGSVQAHSMALPWLVALQLRDDRDRRHCLLVWRDAVPAAVHRALRVYVRWCHHDAANPESERM